MAGEVGEKVKKMAMVLGVLVAVALEVCAEDGAVSDVEIWNEGVSYYESGDVTNALRVLRPLMLSKSHGHRAAEVVAKLEHDRGNLEEAAVASQIALRANPADQRANRNFTRAIDGLSELRKEKHIEKVLKDAQGKDPGAMLQEAVYDARSLLVEAGTYRTNVATKAIAMADGMFRRAERLADVWLPVRELISQSVTNQEQASTIIIQIEQAMAKTTKAAKEIADLNGDAYGTMADVEHDFTRFLKLTALPPAAIGEDAIAQSNAWQDVEAFNGRSWQQDALDYTRAFRAKFPAWARAYEQQAQADTNKPPFTAENQAKISALATELEKLQIECCEKSLPPNQESALDIINQIRELLPKDNSQGNGQSSQVSQPNQQNQQNDNGQQQEQQSGEDQQQEQEAQQPENQEDDKDKDEADQPKEEQSQDDQELEAMLKKAQERNDEHEADKKARMRKVPLPPNERDW